MNLRGSREKRISTKNGDVREWVSLTSVKAELHCCRPQPSPMRKELFNKQKDNTALQIFHLAPFPVRQLSLSPCVNAVRQLHLFPTISFFNYLQETKISQLNTVILNYTANPSRPPHRSCPIMPQALPHTQPSAQRRPACSPRRPLAGPSCCDS